MKKFIFFSFVIFILLILAWIFYQAVSPQKPKEVLPSSTPYPKTGPFNSVPNNYTRSDDQKEKDRRAFLVGQLIKVLPYSGVNFTLNFDYSNDSFILSLDKNKIDEANSELNLFLSQNSIESKSWIRNLIVSYK